MPRPQHSSGWPTLQSGLRQRSFRLCFWSLAALALLGCVVLSAVLSRAAASGEQTPQALAAFLWPVLTQLWAVSLLPSWLIAHQVSCWIGRHIEAPIESIIEECDQLRHASAVSEPAHARHTDELGGVTHAVHDLASHLHRLMQQQYRSVADAAHELRTPLTAQVVVAENALAKKSSSAELREAVGSMLEEARHMHRLIECLLILKRASATPAPTLEEQQALAPQDLSELARGCVNALQVLAEEKGQVIGVKSAGPLWAFVDPTVARQAVLNIVHNAIEHCPHGTHIDVETACCAGSKALIAVTDDGPGIAQVDQARVFESFFRGSGSSKHRGYGLGLAIAKATMASQGGSIRLDSQPGHGCRFELLLPLSTPSRAEVETPAKPILRQAPWNGSRNPEVHAGHERYAHEHPQ